MFDISKVLENLGNFWVPYDASTGQFIPVDLDDALEQLDIASRTRDMALEGIPAVSSKEKDSIAMDIDRYLARCVECAILELITQRDARDELIRNQVNSGDSISKIERRCAQDRGNLKDELESDWAEHDRKSRDKSKIETEYDDFKKKNRLRRNAQYQKNLTLSVSWILLFFMLECIVNAFTLGSAHPESYLGVIVEIFLFGVINFCIAFAIGGFFFKEIFHIHLWRKMTGIVGTVAFFSLMLFVNLFFAHYRDALMQSTVELTVSNLKIYATMGETALSNLSESFFWLQDFKSYLLFGTGLIMGIGASVSFFHREDRYPGFGKQQRAKDQIEQEHADIRSEIIAERRGKLQKFERYAEQQLSIDRAGRAAAENRRRNVQSLMEKYRVWLDSVEKCGARLYQWYREENLRCRHMSEKPDCFSVTYVLPDHASNFSSAPAPIPNDIAMKEKRVAELLHDFECSIEQDRLDH